jgi:hypothetical protein
MLMIERDFADMPDEFYDFASKFIYTRGYEQIIDIECLALTLWNMQQKIDKLEKSSER